jgi:hypothetical protein
MALKRRTGSGALLKAEGGLKRCSCCEVCECDAGSACNPSPTHEFHWRWDRGPIEVLFDRHIDCCCNDALAYRITYQRMWRASADGTELCVQVITGEGVSPRLVTYRSYHNGTLTWEQTSLEYDGYCSAPGYRAGLESCRAYPEPGFAWAEGEMVWTCREAYGWGVTTAPFQGKYGISYYTAVIPDPSDTCLTNCGACCTPQGPCVETSASSCAALGGTYHFGKHCGDPEIECSPVNIGACCSGYPAYTCSEETEEACLSVGGIWMGAGIPCDADPCPPQPTGACCFIDEDCIDGLTPSACINAGGTFQGANTTCAQSECDPELGACCYYNGFCELDNQASCQANQGQWAGPNTSCSQQTCPTGACCLPSGTCLITSDLYCVAQLFGYFQGDGTVCEGQNCLGCCCLNGETLGTMSLSDCYELGGAWYGPNATCVINPNDTGQTVDCSTIGSGEAEDGFAGGMGGSGDFL